MGADVCRTSSRASRRPPDVISTAAILDPRWRRRKWRHPGPGARFSIPVVEGGGKWRPFRFRSPSWVTSFAGTGNEVTQDGDRKRKGRHFPPPSTIGIEKRALYYFCVIQSITGRITVWLFIESWSVTFPPGLTDPHPGDIAHLVISASGGISSIIAKIESIFFKRSHGSTLTVWHTLMGSPYMLHMSPKQASSIRV